MLASLLLRSPPRAKRLHGPMRTVSAGEKGGVTLEEVVRTGSDVRELSVEGALASVDVPSACASRGGKG